MNIVHINFIPKALQPLYLSSASLGTTHQHWKPMKSTQYSIVVLCYLNKGTF